MSVIHLICTLKKVSTHEGEKQQTKNKKTRAKLAAM